MNRQIDIHLSPRETEVMQLLSEGHTGERIAVTLGIGRRCVWFYASTAREKLGAQSNAEAVAKAAVLGLINVPAAILVMESKLAQST